jgi:RNA-directed DNA polymerase
MPNPLEQEASKYAIGTSTDSAASRNVNSWDQISWPDVHDYVRGLQIRIAKATRDLDWRRVKALQRFLVNSFSAKALAVKRVSENDGKRTPGVDGEIWTTPEAKWQAIQQLDSRDLRPQPLRRVYIPKRGSSKMRPLGIPTMLIRAQQALHLLSLEPVAETRADPNSYGFRRNRGTRDAIEGAFSLLAKKGSAPWVLEGDILGCFDNFAHGWLESHVPMDKTVLRDWLKAGYVESGKLFPTQAGTPQGGIASPTIANIALDGLETTLTEKFGRVDYPAYRRNRVRLLRYADDFVITGSSKELLENEVKPLVEKFLAERGLQLSPTKTIITHISEGFDFLGQNVRMYDDKLIIKPSAKNVKTFLDKVRETIRKSGAMEQQILINLLNPMITGWANYHRHVCSKETFAAVDHHIWRALWRWARRRHPHKSADWRKKRYFRAIGHRDWVFATDVRDRRGNPKLLTLRFAASTPIVRHVKVKSEANPFDPAWDAYFAQRKKKRMQEKLPEGSLPRRLWQQQAGHCPGCDQLIEEEERWAIRPEVPCKEGGTRVTANLKMLHSACLKIFRTAMGEIFRGGNRGPAPA